MALWIPIPAIVFENERRSVTDGDGVVGHGNLLWSVGCRSLTVAVGCGSVGHKPVELAAPGADVRTGIVGSAGLRSPGLIKRCEGMSGCGGKFARGGGVAGGAGG